MHLSLLPLSVMASYPVPLINQLRPSPFAYLNSIESLITVALTFLYMHLSKPFATCTQPHLRHTFVVNSASHMTSIFEFALVPIKGYKLLWNGIHQTGDFEMSAHHARMSLRTSPNLYSVCFNSWRKWFPQENHSTRGTPTPKRYWRNGCPARPTYSWGIERVNRYPGDRNGFIPKQRAG